MSKKKVSLKDRYTPGGDMMTWKSPKLGTPSSMTSQTMKRMTKKRKAKKVKMS